MVLMNMFKGIASDVMNWGCPISEYQYRATRPPLHGYFEYQRQLRCLITYSVWLVIKDSDQLRKFSNILNIPFGF